jgi:DNA-binding NtrC family response regulator
VLQEREFERVGETQTMKVDVRVVAATNVDLQEEVAKSKFREDLFYRLNVVPIELPPLRARREDIVPLARHFLSRYAEEYGLPVPALSPSAERVMRERPWPGNVRELRNTIERAVLLSSSDLLDAADLADETTERSATPEGIPFPATLAEIARSAAAATVTFTGGNKSEAARQLGISRPRLQRLLDATGDSADLSEDSDA